MTERSWLDGYSGQSTVDLLGLERTHRVDSLVLAFEQAIDSRVAEHGLEVLTEAELAILAIEALEREVNNGGYSQFFVNDSCVFMPVIVDALTRIACSETAKITAEAIGALDLETTPSADAVRAALERSDERRDATLEACDTAYFSSGEDIAGMLFSYIKAHQNEVRLP